MEQHNIKEMTWRVVPQNTPKVTRRCAKCSVQTTFVSSDKFRVNANKRSLDVWLVYKCEKCETTWNLTIFSRIAASQIDPELYYGFEKNDAALAWRYAFNQEVLTRSAAVVDWDGVDYEVEGEIAELLSDDLDIHITANYAIPVRVDKIVMRMSGLSRSKLKAMAEKGQLSLSNGKDFNKARFDGDVIVQYRVQ